MARDATNAAAPLGPIIEHAPVGVCTVTPDLRIAQLNDRARATLGGSADLPGRALDEVLRQVWPADAAERLLAAAGRIVAGEQGSGADERGAHDQTVWQLVPLAAGEGTTGAVCYFATAPALRPDAAARLTERRRLRVLSDHRRRLYETILSTTPDLIYVFGLDHRFTYANAALLSMWGRSWDEAIGKNCLELGYPDWHAAMHDREIEQVIATRQPIRGDVPFNGTQGRRMYDYIFTPVFGADGEVVAIAGTTRDVTDRKHAEDSVRESEQRLAEANRMKDEFLATLSHELRTPLNAVLGWAQMLRSGTLRPELQRQATESIERNARAQAQLVDDLLDVSRIMSGKLSMQHDLLNLGPVIAGAVDAVRPAASGKQLRVNVNLDADGPVIVDGDANRLQQVVSNLLSNAVKFTSPGGAIDVELRADATHAEIVVGDTGEGIEPSFLPYVFDRFRQADSAPTRRHGGLGLGLAIVRHLTEAHGGTVSAHSDGRRLGSTFVVRLPKRAAHGTLAAPREADASPMAEIAGARILVVDDERDARELTRAVLESHGGQVITAASAQQAVDVAAAGHFDVLVADIGMPEHDGYWLIRQLRMREAVTGTRIAAIALTAYASARERGEALAAGFDDHLGKPVDTARLVAAVAGAIGERS